VPSSYWRYYRRRSCRRPRSCATKVSHLKRARYHGRSRYLCTNCLGLATCRRHGGGTESPGYCSAQCPGLLFVCPQPSLRSYPSVLGSESGVIPVFPESAVPSIDRFSSPRSSEHEGRRRGGGGGVCRFISVKLWRGFHPRGVSGCMEAGLICNQDEEA
jgi:hypothetical protein